VAGRAVGPERGVWVIALEPDPILANQGDGRGYGTTVVRERPYFSSSIAPNGRVKPGLRVVRERCPRMLGWVLVNTVTGEVKPARCKRLKCPFCVVLEAQSVALAIGLARPERLVRFSLIGDTWAERRARFKRVRFNIRNAGFSWNDCYHVERNPRGTGYHAHLWQHGDYVPQRDLQRMCLREGMGYPDIRQVQELGRSTSYGLKAALGYGMKGVESSTGEQYLALNGGRLVHASRGFWRDGEGRAISGIRGAVRVARLEAYGEPEGRWLLQREAA